MELFMITIPCEFMREVIRNRIYNELRLDVVTVHGDRDHGVRVITLAPALKKPDSVSECVAGIKEILDSLGLKNALVIIRHNQTA